MKEGLIKDALECIVKEIQTLSTICYVISVGAGMFFNHYKYSRFSINIFEYSDILDFLMVPFSDISILGFAFASIQRRICIGKTKDVIFMYRDKATYVIPIHSLVKEIRIR